MPKYLLITSTGMYAPRYEHSTIESAETEAKRLCVKYDCEVRIAEIISIVYKKLVPTVTKKTYSEWLMEMKNINKIDELPF